MYSAGQYIWHHRLYLEPVHTQVIGLTINVKEEIAYKFGGSGKAKTNRASSIFFVELQNVQFLGHKEVVLFLAAGKALRYQKWEGTYSPKR